ncbi:hypothetical protein ACTIVE_4888 [Actinomadura verrucosospora]|uniref:Uncharacterized protein n=1 Tax=Actinomadura verrucosospora TaxID=46165 RepID=A0A7D4A5R9_ACTVE|nr:hypothetical protein ACTIVE_4888 [Actinomadura verrucosospora]
MPSLLARPYPGERRPNGLAETLTWPFFAAEPALANPWDGRRPLKDRGADPAPLMPLHIREWADGSPPGRGVPTAAVGGRGQYPPGLLVVGAGDAGALPVPDGDGLPGAPPPAPLTVICVFMPRAL